MRRCAITAIALFGVTTPVVGHDFTLTDTVVLFKNDGTFQIDMAVDVDELALGAPRGSDAAALRSELAAMMPAQRDELLADLERMFQRRVWVYFDGEKTPFAVRFPWYGTDLPAASEPPTMFGLVARLTGRVPPNAQTFTFKASRAFMAVHLTVFRQDSDSVARFPVGVADESPPYELHTTDVAPAVGADWRATVGRYVVLGFEHILPLGVDHMLFVLGLYLLAARLRPLLWQVTAFTLAHSVTLALALYGVVQLSPRIVEPLIALSIAYVGIENIFVRKLHAWRPVVVFVFGLLHGLGFAGVLVELGLPAGQTVPALAAFNVGVEGGQLAVLLIAFVVLGWARDKSWYRWAIAVPLSALIALVGLYWAVVRTFGPVLG